MSKEKQIEEMAKDLQKSEHWYFNDHSVDFELDRKKTAENLYNAGYHKQTEGVWLTYHCTNGGKSKRGRTVIYKTYTCDACGKSNGRHKANFCPNCGAKMKGGAE